MAATLNDIIADVQGLIGTDPQASTGEITTLIQLRYEHIYETFSWSRRRGDFVLSLVAQVDSDDDDTVSVTNGSAIVTSAGTPFTSGMAGRAIAIADEPMYFFINSVTSTAIVRLGDGLGNEVTWNGDTDSDLSWRVFKTLYSLPSNAAGVISLVGQRPLEEYDGGRDAIDQDDPYRLMTAVTPTKWLYAGEDSSGNLQLEVHGVPTAARVLRGQYLKRAATLTGSTVIPVNRALLAYCAAADVLNMLHAKTGDQSYKDLALFYERKSNEVKTDVEVVDLERQSLPSSIARAPRSGLAGTDWEVSHQLDTP